MLKFETRMGKILGWGKVVFWTMNKLVQTCVYLVTVSIEWLGGLYKLSVQGQVVQVFRNKLNTNISTDKNVEFNLLNIFYTHNPHPL